MWQQWLRLCGVVSLALGLLIAAGLVSGQAQPPHVLAFVSDRTGNEDIYLLDVRHGITHDLIRHPARDTSPVWSPQHRQLAFVSDRSGNNDIYMLNLDNGSLQQLTHNLTNDGQPVWSPDARQIAFVTQSYQSADINLLDVESGEVTPLIGRTSDDLNPVWSPDGQWLSFTSKSRTGLSNAFTLHLATGRIHDHYQDFDCQAQNLSITNWSPDGQQIALVAVCPEENNSNPDVYRLNTVGLENLSNHPAYDSNALWSPDGRYIAFLSARANRRGDIYVLHVESGQITALTNSHYWKYSFGWSPDSRAIAYAYDDCDESFRCDLDIFLVGLDQRQNDNLTDHPGSDTQPAWMPQYSR